MNKQTQNNISVSNESFNAGLKDLKEMAAKQATKQSQSKNNNNAKQ